jgi:hypothetical protein
LHLHILIKRTKYIIILLIIKFQKYLFENYGKSWRAYWLDPHGNFHQVYSDDRGLQGHWHFAKAYCIQHNLLPTSSGPVDELLNRKWVRVTYNYANDKEINFDYEDSYPAPHMLRAIRELASMLGASGIYDDKKNRNIEL